MTGLTLIFGAGAIGGLVAQSLMARGDSVRVAQRSRPADVLKGADFCACDILDARAVREAVKGASQVLLAVGFLYDSRFWRTAWPTAMTNVLEACATVNARVVFLDNLYQLGPQTEPRTEDMPLTSLGEKPVILANVTRMWIAA
ncbi:MAG: NAD-dependent epimerase/dehydratase family protein [Burkholderiales bacterium]